MTNEEIIQRGILIRDETEPAQNTSERVGGVIEGIGRNLADKDTAIEAQAARNGYYQCTVSGTTLAVTAPGFTLPAHGGNIRIKMSAPATGACTLNINGTGAKQLLYNGAALSSANTWEQNEIISVFYDPSGSGQYLASNSQGGGGKAEKIKYDSSQSGLNAINVQEAIDEQSENVKELSRGLYSTETISTAINEGYIKSSDGTIVSPSIYHYSDAIQVQEGQVIHTRAWGSNAVLVLAAYGETYAAILEKSIVGDRLAGDSSIMTIDYVVPTGIKYIRVCTRPEYVDIAITKSTAILPTMQAELGEVEDAVFNLTAAETIPAGASTKGYYTYENGSIVTHSNNQWRYWPAIDISDYFALQITFSIAVNTNPAGAKTFFTDENNVKVGDFLYNKDDTARIYLVPEGAKKLYWSTYYGSSSPFAAIALKGIKKENKIDEKVDKKDFLLSLDAVENYAGKEYHNGAFSSVSNATCRKYDVEELETIYVTTRWRSQTAGYYKVVFVDEENTTISQLFVNTADVDVTLTRQKVAVPSNAKYVYVNNRYGVGMPIVEIEGSGTAIEKKINENSIKKEISILFIGNSLTQDVVTYVPLLLKELAPDLKFKLYIWYNGGYKLSQQLADFNNNVACDIFSICEDGTSWANFNNSVTMASVLSTYKFDIVSIQEYFNYQEISDATTFNSVVEYIENHYAYPFKVVTLFHQPKRDTPAVIFERTKAGNALFLKETVAEDMIPSGIAIYRALSTSLDSLGDQGHLTPDGTHAQEGLPCMMQAYVTAMWILKQVGISMSVNNSSSIVDNSNYDSINVPGPNLGTGVVVGTTEQVRLSQIVAIKAFKEGEYFVNSNLTEHT